MDAEQRQAYLESEGVRCPYCGSTNLEGEGSSSANYYDGYEQIINCKKCGKSWKDIYTLTDVEGVE